MDALTNLYCSLQEENIYLDNHAITSHKAATINMEDDYAIFIDYSKIHTLEQEFLAVVHEYGHCASGATHKLSSRFDLLEKHEYKANKYSVHKFFAF